MSRMERGMNLLNQMQERAVRYYDYKPYTVNDIPYRDPVSEEEKSKAKKIINKKKRMFVWASIAMIAVWIVSLFCAEGLLIKALMLVMVVVVVGIGIKISSGKVQVFTGIAVHKQIRHQNIGSKKVRCIVSVIPESGEKIIYTDVNISKKDYDQVTEGTRVMVVSKVNQAIVLQSANKQICLSESCVEGVDHALFKLYMI